MSIPAVLWHSPITHWLGGVVVPELCPPFPGWAVWLLLTQSDGPRGHLPWWPGSRDGATPNSFRMRLSPGPGFSDKQALTQSCLAPTCLLASLPALALLLTVGGALLLADLLLVQPILPAGRANTCPQQGKLATSETNLTHHRNICLFTRIYTSRPPDLQTSSHERGRQMLEHVVPQEEHFLHRFSSGKGNLQGRASQSFESHQEQERATSVCCETCLENKSGQCAASPGPKGDARKQKETKHQTYSRWLHYINTSPGSGAHPDSFVNTPGQHYPIPVMLKPGEKITICYCI